MCSGAEGDLESVGEIVTPGAAGRVAVPELEVASVRGLDAVECGRVHVELLAGIASAVEEQGAATGEISRNVQEAASGTQNVAKSIVAVKAGAEETGGAASEVVTASKALSERFQGLRKEVSTFISDINAAECMRGS